MLYKKLPLYLLPGTNKCFNKEYCICRFVLDFSLHFAVFRMVFSGYDRGRFTFVWEMLHVSFLPAGRSLNASDFEIKNREKQEVDFLIVNGDEPALLIEAKLTDTNLSPVLKKFQNVLNIPAVQLVNEGDGYRRFSNNGQPILVAPAFLWLAQLP